MPSGYGPGAGRAGSGQPPVGDHPPVLPPPPTGRPVPHRRRRGGSGFGRVLVTLVALYLAFLVATPVYLLGRGGTLDALPAQRAADTPGRVVLLAGTDSRDSSTNSGSRTDTIMLLVMPTSGKPALISIPRDSYVTIPGHGKNKINAAYAFGGPQLLVRTVEANTGLRVDDYLEIGMTAFPRLVNSVGGVSVCLDKPMVDKDSHANLPAGCQTLDGDQALAYSRMRKSDPQGDIGRAKRQREIVGKVADRITSPAMLLPWRYWQFWSAATDLVHRDHNTSMLELARIGLGLRQTSGSSGLTLVVPLSNTNAQTPAGSSVLWDEAKARAMFAQLAKGSTSGLQQYR
ncbi:putative cell wall biosynthesis protein LcpB [Aestuariimicrobium sp. T2.26MG-19.2B]|nr:putative cell wall biosynthesis protein LcpB [Aestuariimicrobium sp. T2.26MG-19.2B]